jgi:hypothetical protein
MKAKFKAIVLINAESKDDAKEVLQLGDTDNFSIEEITPIDNSLKESMNKIMLESDEGENEGLKAIREHEDCTDFFEEDEKYPDIDEEMEVKADLKRKYDNPVEAENQENFCN